jgi:hypothetical protein
MKFKLEVWAWMFLCATLMAVNLYPGFVPHLSNDAFQYLSVAQNTLAGRFGYTSLVHYDPERSFGVIPAPMVHFPLGYPLAIALVSLIGVPLQNAALLVSALSTLACVPLLAWTATQLQLSRLLRNVVLAGFVLNARVIDFGASALSEAFFTFFILLGVALLVAARLHADSSRGWCWAAAGLAFGAAYWVRYAGMFFVLGLAVLMIRHLVPLDRAQAKGYAVALTVAGAAVVAGIARSILLVGNWQGTVDKKVSHPLPSVLVETLRAGKVLFLGPTFDMPAWTSVTRALFIAFCFLGMAWLMWSYRRRGAVQAHPAPVLKGIPADLLILVLTYSGCMFYAGLTTTISYEARMFVPITPLLLLLLGLTLSTLLTAPAQDISARPALVALGASFCCYVILNLTIVVRPPTDYRPPSFTGLMDSASVDGKTAREAVLDLADPARVVVANYGQAIGHVLGRPTVSLVDTNYSPVEWDEKAIHDVVDRYNAAAIVIYANSHFMPSAFIRQLAQGEAPSWMKLVYRSSEFLVYEPLSRTTKSNKALPEPAACKDEMMKSARGVASLRTDPVPVRSTSPRIVGALRRGSTQKALLPGGELRA